MLFTINDIEKYDISKMRDSIFSFPYQLEDMIEKYDLFTLSNNYSKIDNILILGMGGSAIGAEICQVLIKDKCKVPIYINRNYNIPNWVNQNTLVIASSYSGNTEETIEAYLHAIETTSKIIAISTGGTLSKLAKKNNNDIFIIDKNYQPRAAIGYSVMAILFCLNRLGIIDYSIINNIQSTIENLKKYTKYLSLIEKENKAIKMAENLYNTIPVIYGSSSLTEVIALRFKSQIQENAKMIAYHNVVPEMNHNEIEGQNDNSLSIIWLSDEIDHIQVKKRIKISKIILEDLEIKNYIVKMEGETFIERFLKFIIMTDWISFYLAIINKNDPSPVHKISKLKSMLK